ncbi:MAG TPA: aromatic ring-hydroxylating dioxygenase subunit alpha [Thermoanaerobaculia bacterium]|nr:aromatic ring-hydroxylating dioxygenase subunit alpha [Thermoanaerobaculia bacterium]
MIDPRLEHASTLSSRYYFDPAVLAAENRNIFARTWQLAGQLAQVREPGQYFTANIANEPVLVVRGNDGVLRAMSNVCRHRAGPVAKGEGKRPVLQCGYHGWTYSLDGRLAVTPEFEGVQDFDRASCVLPQFRVEVWNELVFVNLDPNAESLTEFLGELLADMPRHDYTGFRLAHRKAWEVGCNWKVYVDNYLEGYHIPIVHPGLFREIDYPSYRTETKKSYSIQFAPTKRNAERIRASGEDEVRYFWIFPNLMLNVYPDNFSTNLIVPMGEGRTVTLFDWYFADPDAARNQIEDTVAFSDEIQIEDIGICEEVQKGLASSTYDAGRYSPRRENGVHHFHRLYEEAMKDGR